MSIIGSCTIVVATMYPFALRMLRVLLEAAPPGASTRKIADALELQVVSSERQASQSVLDDATQASAKENMHFREELDLLVKKARFL